MSESLVKKQTVSEMCTAWRQSEEDIKTAFSLLVSAEARLRDAFKADSYRFHLDRRDASYRNFTEPEKLMSELKKDAWSTLIDRLELRKFMSVKKRGELDRQLHDGDGAKLPPIEETVILDMLFDMAGKVDDYMQEAVKDVFEFLRPRGYMAEYKTNSEYEIGRKVILGYAIRPAFSGNKFDVCYGRSRDELNALDNVFHLLEGKGMAKTHYGPLCDAIHSSENGSGETEYFKFKCCKNQNLHLEFKRMDLVARLNTIAGGARLRGAA